MDTSIGYPEVWRKECLAKLLQYKSAGGCSLVIFAKNTFASFFAQLKNSHIMDVLTLDQAD